MGVGAKAPRVGQRAGRRRGRGGRGRQGRVAMPVKPEPQEDENVNDGDADDELPDGDEDEWMLQELERMIDDGGHSHSDGDAGAAGAGSAVAPVVSAVAEVGSAVAPVASASDDEGAAVSAERLEPPAQSTEPAAASGVPSAPGRDLVYLTYGGKFGVFTITYRWPGPSCRFGAYQAMCPFHRVNKKRPCTKESPIKMPTLDISEEQQRLNCLRRLVNWCTLAKGFTRARHHRWGFSAVAFGS